MSDNAKAIQRILENVADRVECAPAFSYDQITTDMTIAQIHEAMQRVHDLVTESVEWEIGYYSRGQQIKRLIAERDEARRECDHYKIRAEIASAFFIDACALAGRLLRYAAMLDGRSWRMDRGALGADWATENQKRDREKYGVADEFDFVGDLPEDMKENT